jgi:purine nucleosidase
VLGVAAVALPGVVTAAAHHADVEARGELTRGMLVVDVRPNPAGPPTARVATDVSVGEVRQYIERTLKAAA